MVNYVVIPDKIQKLIGEKRFEIDNIGMSGASVYLYDDMVLKVESLSFESENEYKMMQWLNAKLPVPKIIEHTISNKLSYILMNKCAGKMASSDILMAKPQLLSELLAETLYQIWHVDVSNCPTDNSLCKKLKQAEYRVTNGMVDVNLCEAETFDNEGFRDPEALLYWLQTNIPPEEAVLSHGDLCLPNVFFNDGKLSGLIDLGRCGIADKWCDIAICYRSIRNNYNGTYTGKQIAGFDEVMFFDALQIKPDWEKIRYYLLLDELF